MSQTYYLSGVSLSRDEMSAARAAAFVQVLRKGDPHARVVCLSSTPRQDRVPAAGMGLALESMGRMRLVAGLAGGLAFHIARALGLGSGTWVLSPYLKRIRQGRALVLLGGVFGSSCPHPFLNLGMLALARSLGCPALVLGQQALGPSPWRLLVRRLLSDASVVVARDTGAMKALEELLPARFTPRRMDIVFALECSTEQKLEREQILPPRFHEEGYLCIAPSARCETTRSLLRELAKELACRQGRNVCLIPAPATNPAENAECERILAHTGHHSRVRCLPWGASPGVAKAVIAGSRMAITRSEAVWYHAISSTVPTLILEPSATVRECLAEWGMAQWQMGLGEVSLERLSRKLFELEQQRFSVSRSLKQRHSLSLQSAENNVEWVLDEGKTWKRRPFLQTALAWEET